MGTLLDAPDAQLPARVPRARHADTIPTITASLLSASQPEVQMCVSASGWPVARHEFQEALRAASPAKRGESKARGARPTVRKGGDRERERESLQSAPWGQRCEKWRAQTRRLGPRVPPSCKQPAPPCSNTAGVVVTEVYQECPGWHLPGFGGVPQARVLHLQVPASCFEVAKGASVSCELPAYEAE